MHRFSWSLLILIGLLSACSGAPDATANDIRFVYGLTLQPSGFDPHIHASSELTIPLRSVYDTLVYRHPETLEFEPGLAQSWEISDDGQAYTFNLRRDVVFHDGTAFNAAAVAANLDRITAPETASQRALFLLGPYAGYEIVDDYTIRLLVDEPYSPLLDGLSQVYLGIASPAALAEYGLDRYQFHQVGTGPCTFEDYVPGDRLVLRRNPAYAWGPSFITTMDGRAPEIIEFRFFEDPPARTQALDSGAAQIMGELLPVDARSLTTNSALRILPVSIPGQPLQFLMNTQSFPTIDQSIRRAILYGVNREAIIDAVFQRFSPIAWGPLSASTAFYNPNVYGAYAFDANRARALLNEAGMIDTDSNGYLEVGGAEIELKMIVPTWGQIPEVAQLIQDQMRDIGLRLVLEQVPTRAALLERVGSGDYNLVAYYEFGVDPAFLGRYYGTGGVTNFTGYGDPTLDAILADALRQTDAGARQSLYAQAQQIIMDQALVLPIRDYVNLNGYASQVMELAYDAYGWAPLLANVRFEDG
ncbi:MAG TPA: ABC transporter substrate-binding protein [Candidatus Limnocylindrales bacterium]|nr:ABC transporter substrate-binding protein [Candidatus Limnocylindrales bacterium]